MEIMVKLAVSEAPFLNKLSRFIKAKVYIGIKYQENKSLSKGS